MQTAYHKTMTSTRWQELLSLVVLSVFAGGCLLYQAGQPVARLHVDPSRWMDEATRLAAGNLFYYDFTWPYPPLSLIVAASWVGLFGASFTSIYAFLVIVSCAIVLASWYLLRLIGLNPWLATFGTSAAVLFSFPSAHARLFSLNVYSPAPFIATLGGLLMLIGLFHWLRRPRSPALAVAGIGMGIALLSKPEQSIACLGVALASSLLIIVARRRDAWRDLTIFWSIGLLLPLIIYIGIGLIVGFTELTAGLLGYGIAGMVAGIALSIGETHVKISGSLLLTWTFLIASVLAIEWKIRRAHRISPLVWLPGIIGIGAAAISFMLLADETSGQWALREYSTGGFQWLGIVLMVVILVRARFSLLRFGQPRYVLVQSIFLLALYTTLSLNRAILESNRNPSLVFPVGALLLIAASFGAIWYIQQQMNRSHRLSQFYLIIPVFITMLPLVLSFIVLNQLTSITIQTARGTVVVPEAYGEALTDIMQFVNNHADDDTIIFSCPNGSGLNYLLGSASPFAQTQCVKFVLPEQMQARLEQQLHMTPPDIIITASDAAHARPWEVRSQESNPALWDYINTHYVLNQNLGNNRLIYNVYTPSPQHPDQGNGQ